MSSFGAKRKARKITVQEDDEDDNNTNSSTRSSTVSEPEQEPPLLQATFKSRKPFKQSSLRKSINANEGRGTLGGDNAGDAREEAEEEDTSSPVVRRPQLGRSGSTKSKKRQSSSSRLSFGPGGLAIGDGDDDGDSILLGEPVFTPKKPISGLVQTASENSAIKKGMARNNLLPGLNRLAMRSADSGGVGADDDEGRPRYSKEYLSELQNSTPNTPQNIRSMHTTTSEDDEMSLDPSELEGAMIVDTGSSGAAAAAAEIPQTAVLSAAEIREKKERRARLAKQQSAAGDDFISLSDDGGDDSTTRRTAGESYLTVLSRQSHLSSSSSSKNKKKESRLVAEDEDLGEGFDSFVEDAGGLSLSRKAEREARKKQRAAMASMIQTAEGANDDEDGSDSDDSEAERRAAYEKAQTRAGMDGLKRKDTATTTTSNGSAQLPPPKITPLPDLSVLVADFKAKMARKEAELQRMRARIDELRAERDGVLAREPEVQKLLDEAGERYKALTAPAGAEAGTVADDADENSAGVGAGEVPNAQPGISGIAAAQSLLNRARGDDTPLGGARGLDSLGTTPTRQPPVEMEF